MTTIHVRYEILDDPRRPSPDSVPDAAAWGVRAVGLPGELSAYGVGDTLEEALVDLSHGVRILLGDGPIPDELTREIEVTSALLSCGGRTARGFWPVQVLAGMLLSFSGRQDRKTDRVQQVGRSYWAADGTPISTGLQPILPWSHTHAIFCGGGEGVGL
jgi:hypothetical protein